MKKYLWIVALIAALSMVMTGCDTGNKDPDDPIPEGEREVIFRLTEEIQKMVDNNVAVNTGLDYSATGVFKDLKITTAAEENKGFVIKIVPNGETYAFDINTGTQNWGAGLDLKHSEIKFKTGDTVEVTGRILETFPPTPSTGDTWASPLLYLDCGQHDNEKTEEKKSPTAGSYKITHTLTAANINDIGKPNPPRIRIGARPAGAKFTIDEITVSRVIATEPAVTYTVTFLDTDKTTVLGKKDGIDKGLTVPDITGETWYTTFKSSIPANKEFDNWYNLANDTVWKLAENAVTADVSLYAKLVDKQALPAGFFKLDEIDSSNWWYTNGRDGKTSSLDAATLAGAKYLVLKVVSVAGEDGFGGIQLALQSSTDADAWHDQSVCEDWNKPEASKGAWDIANATEETFFIVIDLTAISWWNTFVTSTDTTTLAKLGINGGLPSHLKLSNAYLIDKNTTVTQPTAKFVISRDSITYGWAAQTVPGL